MFHVSSKIFHLFVFFSALKIVSWFFIVFESSLPTLIDIISFILIVLMVFFFAIEIQSFPLSPHSVRIVSLSLIMEVVINVPLPFFEKKMLLVFLSCQLKKKERWMTLFGRRESCLENVGWYKFIITFENKCVVGSQFAPSSTSISLPVSPYTFFSKFLMFFTKSFASTRDIIQSLSDLF